MRQKYVNQIVSKAIESFLIKANTGSIQKTEHGTTSNLFQYIDEKKKVCGYLESKGLDAWARGTKEPARIIAELNNATWEQVQLAPERGKSMWD